MELARAELGSLEPCEVLMVGDTLETDVRGARAVGLASALVLSGNTIPSALAGEVESSGLRPDHLCSQVSA